MMQIWRSRIVLVTLALLIGAAIFFWMQSAPYFDRSPAEETLSSAPDMPVEQRLNAAVLPPVFRDIKEEDGNLMITGTSEPDAIISLQSARVRLRQIKADEDGNWQAEIAIEDDEWLALEASLFQDGNIEIKGDETIYRIPAPPIISETEDEIQIESEGDSGLILEPAPPPALILITAPGGPSTVMQSPFSGNNIRRELRLLSIDYDAGGGAIFAGQAFDAPSLAMPAPGGAFGGRIRLTAQGDVIGETRVAPDGKWYFLAGEVLPRGEIEVGLIALDGDAVRASVTRRFDRLALSGGFDQQGNMVSDKIDGLSVIYREDHWQIIRRLFGGGQQYSVIFGPEITPESTEP